MDFTIISNIDLHERMLRLSRTERKLTHHILLHINEVESRGLYLELGFGSMIDYLTKGLGYSEGSAYRRLQSARLLKSNPGVAAKIEDGSLNLSQLAQVQKHIRAEKILGKETSTAQVHEVLEKLENKNSFETSQELAIAFDMPMKETEVLKPQRDKSIRMELTLTEEQFKILKHAKESMSHVTHENSWTDVIVELASRFVKSKTGNKNAKSASTSCATAAEVGASAKPRIDDGILASTKAHTTKSSSATASEKSPVISSEKKEISVTDHSIKNHRKYISVHAKRFLLNKAHHRCEYVNSETGVRCGSNYQLQLDHVWPRALGGSDELPNLRVLCGKHNRFEARRIGVCC
jgi:hypothetical protein